MRLAIGFVLAPLFVSLSARGFQNVHVINAGSGTALQTAIDAAQSGDTILLHNGGFPGCTISAKSLNIVAEPELGTLIGNISLDSIAAGQRCVLTGLRVQASVGSPVILATNCAGSVRFEGLHVRGAAASSVTAVIVAGCADFASVRCTFEGGSQLPTTAGGINHPAGAGFGGTASNIALYDCTVVGGAGQIAHFIDTQFNSAPAGAGAIAVDLTNGSTLFASRSTFIGGAGGMGRSITCAQLPCGFAPTAGADGGAGVRASPNSIANLLTVQAIGGAAGLGGSGGQCCPQTTFPNSPDGVAGPNTVGPTSTLSANSSAMTVASIARANATLNVTVAGTPGDIVLLAFSAQTHFAFEPLYSGVFLFGPSGRRTNLGLIPGSGTLQASLSVGSLPLGTLGLERYVQILTRSPSGQVTLGSPTWITVLDPSF